MSFLFSIIEQNWILVELCHLVTDHCLAEPLRHDYRDV